jgi:hypothetical protein
VPVRILLLGIAFPFLVGKSVNPDSFHYCAYRSAERLITRGWVKNDTFIIVVRKLTTRSQLKKK